nr:hypothetical protein [Lederbergia lenta]
MLEQEKEHLVELLPNKFRSRFSSESFLSGGAIYSLHNGQEPNDFDFFIDNEKLGLELRNYFNSLLADQSSKEIKVGIYKDVKLVLTDNGITLGKYQIVTRWYGNPRDVVNEFDFKHNMFYIYKGELNTYSKWEYLDDNVLRYNEKRARDICGTIIRTRKFVERGFKLRNNEMAKMLLKLNEVGFNERELEILKSSNNGFGS